MISLNCTGRRHPCRRSSWPIGRMNSRRIGSCSRDGALPVGHDCSQLFAQGKQCRSRSEPAGVPPAEVGISVVTEAELRLGLARLPQASRWIGLVESRLLRVVILSWASDSAK